jgi:hypothetical protein
MDLRACVFRVENRQRLHRLVAMTAEVGDHS